MQIVFFAFIWVPPATNEGFLIRELNAGSLSAVPRFRCKQPIGVPKRVRMLRQRDDKFEARCTQSFDGILPLAYFRRPVSQKLAHDPNDHDDDYYGPDQTVSEHCCLHGKLLKFTLETKRSAPPSN